MIRRILEYLDNRKELEEMKKEYSQMKEVLTFNFEKQDKIFEDIEKLIENVNTTVECNDYNKFFDDKVKLRKIKELILDFNTKISSYK